MTRTKISRTKISRTKMSRSNLTKTKSSIKKPNMNKSNMNKSNKNSISNLSILSYNISWESMSGLKPNWKLCNNNTDVNDPRHSSVCVNNISDVFENENIKLDFVTLQEAKDFKKLIKQSPKLQNMNYVFHQSGLDMVVTLWDKKYKLKSKITGEFEKGRPWLATIFTNGMCLINVHMGHYDKEEEMKLLDKMILDIKVKLKDNKDIKDNKNIKTNKKVKTNKKEKDKYTFHSIYRYIISGDFNYDIKEFGNSRNYFTLDDTKFYYNKTHLLTCCINRRKHNDHVIDSLEPPLDITIPKVNYMASDHKPILVIVKE